MKLAVIGSRTLSDNFGYLMLQMIGIEKPHEVVTGCATGADMLARILAETATGKRAVVFKADWSQGKKAGPLRNQLIADYADRCLAFIDKPLEKSRGTRDCVEKFERQGKPVMVVYCSPHWFA